MFEPRAEAYVQADAELVTDLATKERIWSSGLFPFPLETFFGAFDHPDFVLIRLTPTVRDPHVAGRRRHPPRHLDPPAGRLSLCEGTTPPLDSICRSHT